MTRQKEVCYIVIKKFFIIKIWKPFIKLALLFIILVDLLSISEYNKRNKLWLLELIAVEDEYPSRKMTVYNRVRSSYLCRKKH